MGYDYNSETQTYINEQKREYTYNDNGNRILYIVYDWDIALEAFIPDSKYENAYDSNGNETLEIKYDGWDAETQSLIPDYKYEYSFDANNFKTHQSSYTWQAELEAFIPSFKTDISTQTETSTQLVRAGITSKYDADTSTWNALDEEALKSYWYYTKETGLSISKEESNSFSIYPNPANDFLTIKSLENLNAPHFELYDLKGSKILSKTFEFDAAIDISNLQPALYIYTIKDGNSVKQDGKIIIE
jgi:hypothetical protein